MLLRGGIISLTADADADELSGKTFDKSASDLQSDIEISNGVISGTLRYVTGYQAFSGDMQNGNFIALHVNAPEGAVVTGELVGGVYGPVTLDDDRVIIFRVTSTEQKVKFVASQYGDSTTYEFALTGLTLEES